MLNNFYLVVLLVLCLFQTIVYSDVTYTAPTTAVYDDSSSQLLSYEYYSTSPIQRIATFSGLNKLSNSAVVTIQIWFRHTYNSDVTIRLYSPDGDYITLSNERGGGNDNVFDGTLFTDSASTKVSSYSFSNNVVATSVRPENPLSTFRGKDPNGQWKIWLSDCCSPDNGYLNRVILTITGIFFFKKMGRLYKKIMK